MKSWLKDNGIEMHSTHNAGKYIVAERFIRTLKTRIYKHMTSIFKNVYIDKLDEIVNKYNNTYHDTNEMKPVNVKYKTYLKIDDHVKISKYKNIIHKGYTPNWSEEIFAFKKVKNTVPWTNVINDLNDEEIVGTFYEKELRKTNQTKSKI